MNFEIECEVILIWIERQDLIEVYVVNCFFVECCGGMYFVVDMILLVVEFVISDVLIFGLGVVNFSGLYLLVVFQIVGYY